MNLQAEKQQLIRWVESLNNPALLAELQAFKKATEEGWWDLLSDTEKLAIEEGMAQLERGEAIPNEQVIQKIKLKFGV